jgi:hypothetical protein
MKQDKLVKKVYQACLEHDADKELRLLRKEFRKIFKRRDEGKTFSSKWTVMD